MKTVISKTLSAVALATASLCAHADGVSFYGLLDGGIGSTSISGTTTTEFITGGYAPNFVGATGSKDLGKGYTGGFDLQQGFLLNTPSSGSSRFGFGNDSIFNRSANLYLKGDFGKLAVGTQANAAFDSVLLGDARFGSDYGSSLAAVVIDGGMTTRDSGALSYTSPTFYNLTAVYEYIPQSASGSTTSYTIRSGSRGTLTYAAGPLKATIAAYKTDQSNESVNRTGTILGATYKVGPVDLKALYVTQKNATYDGLKTWGLGGAYFATADLTFDFGLYKTTESATDYQSLSSGVGVQYALAKGMTAYFQYANVKNTGAGSVAYAFVGDTQAGFFLTAGQVASTYNAGILYSF